MFHIGKLRHINSQQLHGIRNLLSIQNKMSAVSQIALVNTTVEETLNALKEEVCK